MKIIKVICLIGMTISCVQAKIQNLTSAQRNQLTNLYQETANTLSPYIEEALKKRSPQQQENLKKLYDIYANNQQPNILNIIQKDQTYIELLKNPQVARIVQVAEAKRQRILNQKG